MHQALHRNPFEDIDEDDTDDLDDNTVWKPIGPGRFPEYRDGTNKFIPNPDVLNESDNTARLRRDAIRNSMKHAWNGYKKSAWGADEMLPISEYGHDNWGGMGVTLVDALDTLWLMDMKDEFWEARNWVRDHLDHDHVGGVSVFETTIRSLGGLLSAYDWSGDKVFLDQAKDLGERLFHAFDSGSGFPSKTINLHDPTSTHMKRERNVAHEKAINLKDRHEGGKEITEDVHHESTRGLRRQLQHVDDTTSSHVKDDGHENLIKVLRHGEHRDPFTVHHLHGDRKHFHSEISYTGGKSLAEVGTLQVENRYLAKVTGIRKYADTTENVIKTLKENASDNSGLYPTQIRLQNNMPEPLSERDEITFGGRGDSFYEYLLKIWLQGGKKEQMYRDMYDKAMDGLHDLLILKTERNGLTFIAQKKGRTVSKEMDHLACFMAGSLALGAYTHPDGLESPKAQRDLKTGKALAYTCYQT